MKRWTKVRYFDSLIDQTFSVVDAFSHSVGNITAAGLSIVL